MSELKAGDALDFIVGDKTLTIEPVPYANIKKIIRMAFEVSKDIAAGDVAGIPDMIDRNLFRIFPLLFAKDRYPFITPEWIEDHMTVPTLRKMLEAAIVANGLQDFFEKATGKAIASGAPPTPLTPQEKPGSTISLESVTAGAPKTLTN